RLSGLSRPTVKKLIEGEDSYISKMAVLCDSLNIPLSEVYGRGSFHQEAHSHDNSTANNIGYQIVSSTVKECEALHQRVRDLENLVETKDKLLKSQEKLLKMIEEKIK
ncbi:MAG: hypothetical protein K2K32_00560, partial [Muribaculaceae bacterium]|nr:hypothetical protein [Muribaculaceae bacterium]